MYEVIREGKAAIRVKKADKISKEMEVFYNPVMKLNRDISVLLLNSMDKDKLIIADPLAGTGIRSIRFVLELNKPKIKAIAINDYSKNAVKSIKNNLKLNKINKFSIIKNTMNNSSNDRIIKKNNNETGNNKIKVYNEDANLFLLKSSGFDYIDIDPFGSSNSYLEAAIKRISRKGILAITNTDTAALTGTYPEACARKYWSMAKRDYMMHETGLRILLRKIQLVGMQYEKALIPIFSYFKDHYFRVFFKCIKGKKLCDEVAKQHGMLNGAGPLWMGQLWDDKLANKMYSALLKKSNKKIPISKQTYKNYNNDNPIIIKEGIINNSELPKFLKIIKAESKINAVGFYDLHDIARKKKLKTMMGKDDIIKKIKKKGLNAANTHFSGTGIRSDISYDGLLKLLKE